MGDRVPGSQLRGVFQEPANQASFQELNYTTSTEKSEPNTHNPINEIDYSDGLQELLAPLVNTLPRERQRTFGMIRSRSKMEAQERTITQVRFCRNVQTVILGLGHLSPGLRAHSVEQVNGII